MAQAVKNLLAVQEAGFDLWVGMMPWRREWPPVFLLGEFRGQRSLAGYSPRGPKEWDTVEQVTLSLLNHSLKYQGEGARSLVSMLLSKRHCCQHVHYCSSNPLGMWLPGTLWPLAAPLLCAPLITSYFLP